MEVWNTFARWKSFGVKSRDRFSISNGSISKMWYSSKRELESQRSITKERDSPPVWQRSHRRWRGEKRKSKIRQGWKREEWYKEEEDENGWMENEQKFFDPENFLWPLLLFFIAAINEVRFLIMPGCSMILL